MTGERNRWSVKLDKLVEVKLTILERFILGFDSIVIGPSECVSGCVRIGISPDLWLARVKRSLTDETGENVVTAENSNDYRFENCQSAVDFATYREDNRLTPESKEGETNPIS